MLKEQAAKEGWLKPSQVIEMGLVPWDYDALLRKFKEPDGIRHICDAGRIYTKREWIEEFLSGKQN